MTSPLSGNLSTTMGDLNSPKCAWRESNPLPCGPEPCCSRPLPYLIVPASPLVYESRGPHPCLSPLVPACTWESVTISVTNAVRHHISGGNILVSEGNWAAEP